MPIRLPLASFPNSGSTSTTSPANPISTPIMRRAVSFSLVRKCASNTVANGVPPLQIAITADPIDSAACA